MTPRFHGKRALLNRPGFGTTAAIVAEVEDSGRWPKGRNRDGKPLKATSYHEPESTLQIANCDRSVAFDLDFDTPHGYRNSLHKIDVMIDALQRLREGVEIERERYVEREKHVLPGEPE